MNKLTAELLRQLKSAAQEEIMCREASDTSDAWQDLASPENVLALLEIALPVLEQQGGWISCSERMPEKGTDVLACRLSNFGGYEEIETAQWHGGMKSEQPVFITSADTIEPSHWQLLMPTPQPSTTPQIDNDGWIDWKGGECPVLFLPSVEVKFRNGQIVNDIPHCLDWSVKGCNLDIIAYRVIENDGREG